MKCSHYSRRAVRAAMWGATFFAAFLCFGSWAFALSIEPASPASAIFLSTLATVFGLGAAKELREAIRCYDIHHRIYETPNHRNKTNHV